MQKSSKELKNLKKHRHSNVCSSMQFYAFLGLVLVLASVTSLLASPSSRFHSWKKVKFTFLSMFPLFSLNKIEALSHIPSHGLVIFGRAVREGGREAGREGGTITPERRLGQPSLPATTHLKQQ